MLVHALHLDVKLVQIGERHRCIDYDCMRLDDFTLLVLFSTHPPKNLAAEHPPIPTVLVSHARITISIVARLGLPGTLVGGIRRRLALGVLGQHTWHATCGRFCGLGLAFLWSRLRLLGGRCFLARALLFLFELACLGEGDFLALVGENK